MTFNEIRAEALRLMFADMDIDADIESVDDLGGRVGLSLLEDDENIGSFLKGMRGSVNRALSFIEAKGVLPDESADITLDFSGDCPSFTLPLTCFHPIRIARTNDGGVCGNVSFQRQGAKIFIPDASTADAYTLIYKPRIDRIMPGVCDFHEINIPDGIASLIPYFIKSELFREEEPAEAGEARNWFEQALAEMTVRQDGEQRSVDMVYGGMI